MSYAFFTITRHSMSNTGILLADIGGTNVRFARSESNETDIQAIRKYRCADFLSITDAIGQYLESVSAPAPAVICIAAAGPVVGESITLTNYSWTIDAADLAQKFGSDSVHLLNDFDAIAYAIPLLGVQDCFSIGNIERRAPAGDGFMVGVVGPGTGLGTSALCRIGGHYVAIGGEAGYAGFAAETDEQREIAAVLREKSGRVAAEHLLSGPGLENIFRALCRIRGTERQELSAAEIGRRSQDSSDDIAADSMRIFFEVLGQYAGDVALMYGALDGIYLAGGIAKRYPDALLASAFRKGFENKAPHEQMMSRIPTTLITHEEPGLLGASHYAFLQGTH